MSELPVERWEAVYSILVECCGASELARGEFLAYMARPVPYGHEFRFMGWLGMGGKLYSNSQGVYVDCYSEQKTPLVTFAIKVANERIQAALAARGVEELPPNALRLLRRIVKEAEYADGFHSDPDGWTDTPLGRVLREAESVVLALRYPKEGSES